MFSARIPDGLKKIVVTGNAAAVFGRTLKFAVHTDRIGNARFGWQHFLHHDRVLPTVAKVVSVQGLRRTLPRTT